MTAAVLNRPARDGVRIRAYAPWPGEVVPCAVWADDDLVVTRIHADLADIDSVTLMTHLDTGEEISRLADLPVREGRAEIIREIPAALLRHLPSGRIRLTVSGRIAGVERTVSEYVLEHAGAFERSK